jgi:hypothetical protein
MRRQDWISRKEKLERLFAIYDTLPTNPPDLRIHWVRYLVVRTSGFIETSVSYFYNQYAADKASLKIRSFLEARLESPGNLRMDRIMRLVQEFSGDWYQEIESHTDFDRIRAAINSVVANRNTVAHAIPAPIRRRGSRRVRHGCGPAQRAWRGCGPIQWAPAIREAI